MILFGLFLCFLFLGTKVTADVRMTRLELAAHLNARTSSADREGNERK